MNRIDPLEWEDMSALHDLLAPVKDRMGFVPTSQRVMARKPKILTAFIGLTRAVYDPDAETPLPLRNMVAMVASQAAGCLYCQAHTSSNASRAGLSAEKIAAVWEFETHPLFDNAERAALRFALAAGSVPNAVTDEIVEDLKQHFSQDQIVELMAVVAMFGFLNRWNDSMATGLEDEPLSFAENNLADTPWQPGKHKT
ncbi:carboxymuconolactone decarboxylase family protein [Cognatishimia sp. SS12]|uniref:carboxymuconolactone decarboxylase family protein n=1 Tax=Cognatishimia sp. SS12 TaxID=2979465 RepID=UPI00232EB9A7|nr:carboxymuconolactone decarboxylase family protein [Cognatishimia sp. SS12]MDC0738066.1 carboxymuconolactone decarboxylase family protein [Cognatishimia sp. SS12]